MSLLYDYLEIDSLMTQTECTGLSSSIESKNIPGIKGEHINNQYRIMFEDESIKLLVQEKLQLHEPHFNVSVKFSYVKYENEGLIPCHLDCYTEQNVLMTMIIYLNDDYQDGKTYLHLETGFKTVIENKTGKALLFMGSKIPHGCDQVIGTKKILAVKLCAK